MDHPCRGTSANSATIINLHAQAKSRTVTLADLPRAVTTWAPGAVDPSLLATHQRLQAGSVSLRMAVARLIETALTQHRGNLSSTDKTLGISRPTLYAKRNEHGQIPLGRSQVPGH